MIVFHVMVQRFCPVQNAALCAHKDFESYLSCPLLGFYHSLVSEGGEVLRASKELAGMTLQGCYLGSWQIVGYLGVRQSAPQADAMLRLFNELEAEHVYGPGIHALGHGVAYEDQLAEHLARLQRR